MMTNMVPLEVGMAIGQILSVRESKLYLRKKHINTIRGAEHNLSSARQDYRMFGMYDDCGPSYRLSLTEAEERLRNANEALSLIQSFSKYLKRLKYEFLEKHMEWIDLLDEQLNAQTKRIQAEMRLNRK